MEAVAEASPARSLARLLAGAAFLVLVVGLTYFAILVFRVRFGPVGDRAAAYREIGQFLSGSIAWYQDARMYGTASLLLSLLSLLFGSHPLARITLVVSGLVYVAFLLEYERIAAILQTWAGLR